VVAISEIDEYALKVYESLYGKTDNFGDIAKIEKLSKVDLWTYPLPYTDISLSGRIHGLEKVVDYPRVSTGLDEQNTSYEAQVKYYTEYISNNLDWEFVKIYADE